MIKKAFLDRMYDRRAEAQDGYDRAKKSNDQSGMQYWEGLLATINSTIKDYIGIHQQDSK